MKKIRNIHLTGDGQDSGDSPTGKSDYLPRVASGAVINFSGIIGRMILVYGYTFLLARMLSVSELGEYFLMFTIINLLGLAALVGLDTGVVRYVALYAGEGRMGLARKTLQAGLMFGLPVSLLFTAVLFVNAQFVSDHFFENSADAVNGIRIFSLAIPLLVAARLFNATTQGMHQMKYQVLSRDICEQIAKIGLSFFVLIMGAGLLGVVWANVIAISAAVVLAFFFAMKVLAGPRGPSDVVVRPAAAVLRYSFPLAFANIVIALLLWVDTLMLGYLGSPEDVGLYGVALKISVIGAKIITAFAIVFTPIIADLWNRGRKAELQELYLTVSRWIFMLSIPIFLLLVLFPDSLMSIFGPDFAVGGTTLVFLAIGQLLSATTGAAGLMVIMSGHSKIELLNVTVTLAFNAMLCFLLIPHFGITGAAIAHMSGLGLVNLMRVTEIWIIMRIYAYDRSYLKPVIAAITSAVVITISARYIIRGEGLIQLASLASLLIIIYVLSMLLLGLEEQDKDMLRKLKGMAAGIKTR
ncbi:MAG: oligosaccharide flippase family protein [Actinobacteria bacterium]|nr:oligosaccharide flippase family protein [Actinomycetota bacterium]